jgi:hypothetical protein
MRWINRLRAIIAEEIKQLRTRLPNKRDHIVCTVPFKDARGNKHEYRVGFGPDSTGTIWEVFCSDGKSGSDRQSMIHDGCILMSLALQHGASIADIAHSMSELTEEDQSGARPASPFGAIAEAGAALEQELKGAPDV